MICLQNSLVTDYIGLLPERIEKVVKAEDRIDLQRIVKEANQKGQKISVAGLQHSQGGHTYYEDGIVLDMRTFNRILEIILHAVHHYLMVGFMMIGFTFVKIISPVFFITVFGVLLFLCGLWELSRSYLARKHSE